MPSSASATASSPRRRSGGGRRGEAGRLDRGAHHDAAVRGKDAHRQLLRIVRAAHRLPAHAGPLRGRAAEARRAYHPALRDRRGGAGLRRPRVGQERARRDRVPAMSGRILVVDDQRAIAEMMAGVLQGRGYEVFTAFDGETALLRVKRLEDEVVSWNMELEGRVREQVSQLERLSRLKRFFSREVAEAIVAGGEEILKPHRRDITAVFLDLRGFTAFTDRADPDEVLELLRTYHATLGATVEEFGGTLEHFAGDGMMIIFNDPFPVDRPAERAARMAMALQRAFDPIARAWAKLGHDVGLGIGIAQGEATLGVIGFEQRWEYAAIGNVPNLAARLCGAARAGEIILDAQTETAIAQIVDTDPVGPLTLRGFAQPVAAFRLKAVRGSSL